MFLEWLNGSVCLEKRVRRRVRLAHVHMRKKRRKGLPKVEYLADFSIYFFSIGPHCFDCVYARCTWLEDYTTESKHFSWLYAADFFLETSEAGRFFSGWLCAIFSFVFVLLLWYIFYEISVRLLFSSLMELCNLLLPFVRCADYGKARALFFRWSNVTRMPLKYRYLWQFCNCFGLKWGAKFRQTSTPFPQTRKSTRKLHVPRTTACMLATRWRPNGATKEYWQVSLPQTKSCLSFFEQALAFSPLAGRLWPAVFWFCLCYLEVAHMAALGYRTWSFWSFFFATVRAHACVHASWCWRPLCFVFACECITGSAVCGAYFFARGSLCIQCDEINV